MKKVCLWFYGDGKFSLKAKGPPGLLKEVCVLCISVCYLGEGVFWEVLVGEVTGLDQLAGDRGVWRVRGLPIGA